MGFLSQLKVLMWKNFLVQWRSKIWTIFELIPPLFFTFGFVFVRSYLPDTHVLPTNYTESLTKLYGDARDHWPAAGTPDHSYFRQRFQVCFINMILDRKRRIHYETKEYEYERQQNKESLLRTSANRENVTDEQPVTTKPYQFYFAPDTKRTRKIMESLVDRYKYDYDVDPYLYGQVVSHGFGRHTVISGGKVDPEEDTGNNATAVEIKGFESAAELENAALIEFNSVTDCVKQVQSATEQNSWQYEMGVQECRANHIDEYLVGVVFDGALADDSKELPLKPSYTLRFSQAVGSSPCARINGKFKKSTFPEKKQNRPTYAFEEVTMSSGFLSLQLALDQILIDLYSDGSSNLKESASVQFMRTPYPAYDRMNIIINIIMFILPIFFVLTFLLTSVYASRNICAEKESRVRDYMRMMGLNNLAYWMSHFLTAFIKLSFVMLTIVYLLCIKGSNFKQDRTDCYGETCIVKTNIRVLPRSDASLMAVIFLTYAIAIITHSFAIAVVCKTGSKAGAATVIFWLVSYVPAMKFESEFWTMEWQKLLLLCLPLNSCWAIMISRIKELEMEGFGLNWTNLGSAFGTNEVTSLAILNMLVVDIVLAVLITWYVDTAFPGGDSIGQSPLFPLQISYWKRMLGVVKDASRFSEEERGNFEAVHPEHPDRFEKLTSEAQPFVDMRSLGKTFNANGRVYKAVNELNLQLLEGQVTALLGHNGAGKSTTISMLTGTVKQTSGTAIVGGYDLENMAEIRKFIGVCPQYNVFFNNLTLIEHLQIFCQLKEQKANKLEMEGLLRSLALSNNAHAAAKTLSGGMKRKLAVAIALVGGSKLVILDEPTSGMDPNARHETWTLLQKEREHRTILLTTHYMEEADLLGDRIAIMAHGKLHCCGTSMFLKKKYGVGYRMTVVYKDSNLHNMTDDTIELLRRHSQGADVLSTNAAEATFMLPTSDRNKFPSLFSEFEANHEKLNVSSYGISITTMEEVFLRAGRESERPMTSKNRLIEGNKAGTDTAEEQGPDLQMFDSDKKAMINTENLKSDRKTGVGLWISQYIAMIKKRICYIRRSILTTLLVIVAPILGILLVNTNYKPGPAAQPFDVVDMFKSPLLMDVRSLFPLSQPFVIGKSDFDDLKFYNSEGTATSKGIIPTIDLNVINEWILGEYERLTWTVAYQSMVVGAVYNTSDSLKEAIILYSNEAQNTMPVSLNLYSTALLRKMMKNANMKIQVYNHPIGYVPPEIHINDVFNNVLGNMMVMVIWPFLMTAGLMSCFIVMLPWLPTFLAKERTTSMKHLQIAAGLNPLCYWLGHFTMDMLIWSFIVLGFYLSAIYHQVDAILSAGSWFVVLMLYSGLTVSAVLYLVPFFIKSQARVYLLAIIYCVVGLVLGLIHMIFWILGMEMGSSDEVMNNSFIKTIWTVFEWYRLICGLLNPIYNFIHAFHGSYMFGTGQTICAATNCSAAVDLSPVMCCLKKSYYNPNNTVDMFAIEDPGIGRPLLMLTIQLGLSIVMIICVEFKVMQMLRNRGVLPRTSVTPVQHLAQLDLDVKTENERINNASPVNHVVFARNLGKYYNKMKAVHSISFTVDHNECFGLLGVNGAGKTSTFRMLTGEEPIDQGDGYICQQSIGDDWRTACENVGYCPQFEAVLQSLTGRQLFDIFARIRGVPSNDHDRVVKGIIGAVNIDRFADQPVQSYSGGTKRRMSLGLALIGLPPVLMLDEPTAGVDPAARRDIWNTLEGLKKAGMTIILTSHSMEECEALCTRLGIMIAGRWQCIGSTQYLKGKFGKGYALQVKVNASGDVARAIGTIQQSFPGAFLNERHDTLLIYTIPITPTTRWSELYSTMELIVEPLNIVDYTLSQSSLEQIFLAFTSSMG